MGNLAGDIRALGNTLSRNVDSYGNLLFKGREFDLQNKQLERQKKLDARSDEIYNMGKAGRELTASKQQADLKQWNKSVDVGDIFKDQWAVEHGWWSKDGGDTLHTKFENMIGGKLDTNRESPTYGKYVSNETGKAISYGDLYNKGGEIEALFTANTGLGRLFRGEKERLNTQLQSGAIPIEAHKKGMDAINTAESPENRMKMHMDIINRLQPFKGASKDIAAGIKRHQAKYDGLEAGIAAGKVKASDRAFDLTKIQRENQNKIALEGLKQRNKKEIERMKLTGKTAKEYDAIIDDLQKSAKLYSTVQDPKTLAETFDSNAHDEILDIGTYLINNKRAVNGRTAAMQARRIIDAVNKELPARQAKIEKNTALMKSIEEKGGTLEGYMQGIRASLIESAIGIKGAGGKTEKATKTPGKLSTDQINKIKFKDSWDGGLPKESANETEENETERQIKHIMKINNVSREEAEKLLQNAMDVSFEGLSGPANYWGKKLKARDKRSTGGNITRRTASGLPLSMGGNRQ